MVGQDDTIGSVQSVDLSQMIGGTTKTLPLRVDNNIDLGGPVV